MSGSQVKNLRSGVSRVAVCTLGVLYCHLQRAMDKEVDTTARALLHKAAESNAFIREEVDAALGHMVRHCTPARCINAFLDGGLRSGGCTHTHNADTNTLYCAFLCFLVYLPQKRYCKIKSRIYIKYKESAADANAQQKK